MIDKIQAQINKKDCKVWINNPMASNFSKAFAKKLAEKGITASELARRAKTTRANVSRLLNDTPHPISGALPKPTVETVEKIAKALDWDINEARLAAGFAPTETADSPFVELGLRFDKLPQTKKAKYDALIDYLDHLIELDEEEKKQGS
jgi:transcriptional regulator with XRE-family HTH domain